MSKILTECVEAKAEIATADWITPAAPYKSAFDPADGDVVSCIAFSASRGDKIKINIRRLDSDSFVVKVDMAPLEQKGIAFVASEEVRIEVTFPALRDDSPPTLTVGSVCIKKKKL